MAGDIGENCRQPLPRTPCVFGTPADLLRKWHGPIDLSITEPICTALERHSTMWSLADCRSPTKNQHRWYWLT